MNKGSKLFIITGVILGAGILVPSRDRLKVQSPISIQLEYKYYPDGNIARQPEEGVINLTSTGQIIRYNSVTKSYTDDTNGIFYLTTNNQENYPQLYPGVGGGMIRVGAVSKNFVEGSWQWTRNVATDGSLKLELFPVPAKSLTDYTYSSNGENVYHGQGYIFKEAQTPGYLVVYVSSISGFSSKTPPSTSKVPATGQPVTGKDVALVAIKEAVYEIKRGKAKLNFQLTIKNNSAEKLTAATRFSCLQNITVPNFKLKQGLNQVKYSYTLTPAEKKLLKQWKQGKLDVSQIGKEDPFKCSFDLFGLVDKTTGQVDASQQADADLSNNFLGINLNWQGKKLKLTPR